MKTLKEISQLDFEKTGGLIPAIIQDAETQNVLMLGYMNSESLAKTQVTGKVTFFSRTKSRLWTKGEESGNRMHIRHILVDCDQDALVYQGVQPCRQDVAGDAEGEKVIEPPGAAERVPQDQQGPALAENLQGLSQGAVHVRK